MRVLLGFRKVLLLLAALPLFCVPISPLLASEPACKCTRSVCRCFQRSESNGWKVVESRSFRIHYVGAATTAERLVPVCEDTRQALQKRWLSHDKHVEWSPKCDLFLYPSAYEFERLTRTPASMMGFADLNIGQGRVSVRGISIRADDAKLLDKVLVHELTHVVMADYFCERQIPRWADEGIAVLSEPDERRVELLRWLKLEVAQGRGFSLAQLTVQSSVPQDKLLGDLFFAQSVAAVEYLLSHRKLSEPQVLSFVAESQTLGLEGALKRHVPDVSLAAFEQDWRSWMATVQPDVIVAKAASQAGTGD